ncbi:MAG: hypothetical protein K1X92_13170, partial [Bacteroidia bacterium]|nr:hypothetical protein [Bacteroidia bacterium]
MKKILLFLLSFSFIWGYSQLPCTPTANVLSASELNAFTNSVTSYTYTATTYGMSYNVTIAKVGGNGPNIFPYGTSSGIWIGKDNGISLDYEDILITFSGDVTGVSLDFVAINNNSDGEERVQNIYPQNAAGNNITAGVTY